MGVAQSGIHQSIIVRVAGVHIHGSSDGILNNRGFHLFALEGVQMRIIRLVVRKIRLQQRAIDNVYLTGAQRILTAAVGTVYHKVMEHIDFALTEVDEVQKAVDQMVEDGVLTADERALVKDGEVHGAIMNNVIKSAVGAKCYHEQPFMMYVPAKDVIDGSTSKDEVLVQGVIDLLVVGKSNFIVDFKYTTFRTEESKEKYKKQLYLYKMAFERAFCEKIEKVVLLSLKTGESFEI